MIINNDAGLLSPSLAGAGSSSASSARQSGRWMAELERALIAEQPAEEQAKTADGNQTNASANPAADDGAADDHFAQEQDSQRQTSNGPAQSQAKSNTSTQTAARADAPVSDQAAQAQHSTDTAQSTNAAPKAAVPQAPAQNTPSPAHAAKASPGGSKAAPAHAREVAHAQDQSAIILNAAAIAAAPAQLESMLGAALRSYAAAGPVSSTQAPATQLASGRAAIGDVAAQGANGKGNATATESDESMSEMAAGADEASTAESESYAPRHMHLVQDGDGVRAWIRDAGLTQPQAVMVAQSLVGELHQSGIKLNGLVLNGKKVASLFQGNQYQNHEVFAAEEGQGGASITGSTATNSHPLAAQSSIDQRGEV